MNAASRPPSRAESFNEKLDRLGDGLRRINERWNNRIVFKDLIFSEDYLKLRFAVVVDLNLRPVPHQSHRACAAYLYFADHDDAAVCVSSEHLLEDGGLQNGNDQVVFVEIVQFAGSPKRFVPSLGRVYLIQDEPLSLWESSRYRHFSEGLFKAIPILVNREGDPLGRFPAGACQHVPGIIKGATQIMNGVADEQGRIVGDWSGIKAQDVFASFRVLIGNETIKVLRSEPFDKRIEIRDVLLGPFNF